MSKKPSTNTNLKNIAQSKEERIAKLKLEQQMAAGAFHLIMNEKYQGGKAAHIHAVLTWLDNVCDVATKELLVLSPPPAKEESKPEDTPIETAEA